MNSKNSDTCINTLHSFGIALKRLNYGWQISYVYFGNIVCDVIQPKCVVYELQFKGTNVLNSFPTKCSANNSPGRMKPVTFNGFHGSGFVFLISLCSRELKFQRHTQTAEFSHCPGVWRDRWYRNRLMQTHAHTHSVSSSVTYSNIEAIFIHTMAEKWVVWQRYTLNSPLVLSDIIACH